MLTRWRDGNRWPAAVLAAALAAAVLVPAVATWVTSYVLFLRGFQRVDEDMARDAMDGVHRDLARQLADMDSIVADWSHWDEPYAYVSRRDPSFLAREVGPATVGNLRLDHMLWCDATGAPLGSTSGGSRDDNASSGRVRERTEDARWCALAARDGEPLHGLADAGAGPSLHASGPVLPSSGNGPAAGWMVIVRDLSSALELHRASSGTSVTLLPAGAPAGNGIAVEGPDSLAAWDRIAGPDGAPLGVLRVSVPRTFDRTARAMGNDLLWMVAGLAVLIGAWLFVQGLRVLRLEDVRRRDERRHRNVLEGIADGILLMRGTPPGIVDANPAAIEMLGPAARDSTPLALPVWLAPMLADRSIETMEAGPGGRLCLGEVAVPRVEAAPLRLEVLATRLEVGDSHDLCVVLHDVTDRRQVEEMIRFNAYHDSLTSLPNRVLFMDRLDAAVRRARRTGSSLAVLNMDLDDFKSVNDLYGHATGDQVLVEAAARLRNALRDSDTVCRQGGDEFVALLPDAGSITEVTAVAARVLEGFRAPFLLEGLTLSVSVSVGVARFPEDAEEVDDLLGLADRAMYRAKARGKDRAETVGTSSGACRRATG